MSDGNKRPRSVTLDPQNDRFLSQSNVNASGLINQLVSRHREGETKAEAVLKYREEQLESEIREIEARLEAKERELAELRERREEIQAEQDTVVEEVDALLDRMEADGEHVAEDHEDVMRLAQRMDAEPPAVIDRLKDRAIERGLSITSGQFMWEYEAEARGVEDREMTEVEGDD